MKTKRVFFLGLLLLFGTSVDALALSYRVTSDFPELNGIYIYWGDIITSKSEGKYADVPMPVYHYAANDYYIGYRGCSTKWVITKIVSPAEPTPETIGGGPNNGLHVGNTADVATPPRTGWTAKHIVGVDAGTELSLEVIPAYDLTINTVGNGTVSRVPGTPPYDENTVVSLTAEPDTGYAFSGWSGDLVSTANPASITMDADKTVTATFVQLTEYDLTTNTVGSGSIALDPPGGTYFDGTAVTVRAEPSAYWTFSAWSGDLSGSTNPTTITMDTDKSITANFAEMADYNLSVAAIGSGIVTLDPPGGTYYDGTIVTLTATPQNQYWSFTGWDGDLGGSDNPITITMDADKNVTAAFTEMGQYNLTVNTVGSGSVSMDPEGGSYYVGTLVTLAANPADAYWSFSGWSGDLSGSTNPASINIDSEKTVTATFALVDTDADGISDRDEDAGANGGDSNNDGTPDRLQSNVACMWMHNLTQMVTLESEAGTTLSNCEAQGNPHPGDSPGWADFPYGFFKFTITGIAPGGATRLILHLPDNATTSDLDSYYKYGPLPNDPTDQWYRFKYESSLQVGAVFNGSTVTLHLIDGEMGDDDLTADGIIRDVGGPAVLDSGSDSDGPTPSGSSGSGGGGGGCFLQLIQALGI
ncbi:MAG: InlB B-repeat-containing protein [Desulfobacteraceae bacterium]|jgi:hypothetical protein